MPTTLYRLDHPGGGSPGCDALLQAGLYGLTGSQPDILRAVCDCLPWATIEQRDGQTVLLWWDDMVGFLVSVGL